MICVLEGSYGIGDAIAETLGRFENDRHSSEEVSDSMGLYLSPILSPKGDKTTEFTLSPVWQGIKWTWPSMVQEPGDCLSCLQNSLGLAETHQARKDRDWGIA